MERLSKKEFENICKPHTPKLWGQTYPEFTPVILQQKFGDGMQLIWFQTCDQRPYWWWIFIDSNTDVDSDEFKPSEIWDAIEEEFGRIPDEDDEDFDEAIHGNIMSCYPMIVYNGGSLWGSQGIKDC